MKRDPNAYEIEAVYEGAPIVTLVEGGVKSKPAQEAGMKVVLHDRDLLIPWSRVDKLRAGVRSRSQQRRVDVQKKGDADGNGE